MKSNDWRHKNVAPYTPGNTKILYFFNCLLDGMHTKILYICDFSRGALNVRLSAHIQHLLRGHKYSVYLYCIKVKNKTALISSYYIETYEGVCLFSTLSCNLLLSFVKDCFIFIAIICCDILKLVIRKNTFVVVPSEKSP